MTFLKHLSIIVISIFLSAAAWAGQERYEPSEGGPGGISVSVGASYIDELALKDVDISKAIEVIARKSGLNIITGQNVKGTVTVFLKHVDAREALRIVLESNGLAFVEEGGIIRVMTADEFLAKYGYSIGQEKTSRLIKLNFASLGEAQKLLEEMKTPQGKVVVNEEAKTILLIDSVAKVKEMEAFLADFDVQTTVMTLVLKNVRAQVIVPEVRRMLTQSIGAVQANVEDNVLVVTDTLARVEKVRKAVEAIDARGRVMVLEAKLVHVVLNDEHPDGVDWSGILEDAQRIRLSGKYDFLAGPDTGRALSFGMILNDDFATLIEALDTVGVVEEYPLVTLRVAGDEQARLVVHVDDPSVEMTAVVPGEEKDGQDIPFAEEAALVFMVKPSFDVTGDVVTAVMPQEIRPLTRDIAGAMHNARPNTLSAKEGYTGVVGGILISERTAAAHKIPLLGDLPLVGFAFRMEGAVRREEFVVFLTPKSISLSQAFADEGTLNDAVLTGGD